MADLVTHTGIGLLVALGLPSRWAVPLAVGSCLPDLVSRVPQILVSVSSRFIPWPDWLSVAFGAFHTPIGCMLWSLVLGLLARPQDRAVACAGFMVGSVLHLGVDVLQDHHGIGYLLGFPASYHDVELGWIGSEATTPWAGWVLGVACVLWGLRLYRDRRESR